MSGSPRPEWRLPANEIETLVTDALADLLRDRIRLVDQLHLSRLDAQALDQTLFAAGQLANELEHAAGAVRRALLTEVLQRVVVGPEAVTLSIDALRLRSRLVPSGAPAGGHPLEEEQLLELGLPVRLTRRGAGLKLVLAERTESARPDRSLVLNLARGLSWAEELRTGAIDSLAAIAKRENLSPAFIRRCCDLAFLPSDVTDAIAEGRQPTTLTSEALKRLYPLPVTWPAQRRVLLATEPQPNSHEFPAAGRPPA